MRLLFLLLFTLLTCMAALAQTDSVKVKPLTKSAASRDSINMAKLNNSGNLMIAAGVGLCGAGSYLTYYGVKVYRTKPVAGSANYQALEDQNKRQGTIYLVAGSVSIAAGIILTAFGAKNKVEFKARKKRLEMQTGLLDNGNLGAMLTF